MVQSPSGNELLPWPSTLAQFVSSFSTDDPPMHVKQDEAMLNGSKNGWNMNVPAGQHPYRPDVPENDANDHRPPHNVCLNPLLENTEKEMESIIFRLWENEKWSISIHWKKLKNKNELNVTYLETSLSHEPYPTVTDLHWKQSPPKTLQATKVCCAMVQWLMKEKMKRIEKGKQISNTTK